MALTPNGHVSEPVLHWLPETETQRSAIHLQLARILASPLFSNSKRCTDLFRFTVELALAGKKGNLKERSLGIDVFKREPDYDTNRDPVVRTTAVEIRKRIAQYYTTPEHAGEIRIAFPAGSYFPEFHLPADWSPSGPQVVPIAPAIRAEGPPVVGKTRSLRWWGLGLAVAVVVAGIATAALVLPRSGASVNALDQFWSPALTSPEPVLILIGGTGRAGPPLAGAPVSPEPAPPVSIVELQESERVAFADASALARIAGFVSGKGKRL